MITSIAVSSDNRFLYLNNFTQGDVRQYDITDLDSPRQVGQVFLGGSVVNGGPVTVHNEEYTQPDPCVIQGRRIFGGPATIRLSSDEKRLYVTNGLYTPWDKQIYPEMVREGSVMMQLYVDTERGGLTVNDDFLVDFGNEPSGPARAHDMRYPLDNLA